ncbi:BTAD domain-containing putative transcriptional regulator [Kitasatospora sp. LaBMicrA B282]|uniref:AfsR/SARP family transcriptional regulator n=1 Tax=Kitasatospora sp. LaBMicrA B282 TaxID=3420949 RepID=UPI003D11D38B
MLEVRLLGTVELKAAGERCPVGPEKIRCLLAAFAWDAGRPLSVGTLANRLWDSQLPADPAAGMYVNVSKLRRALRTAAQTDGAAATSLIVSHGHAYTLDIDPGIVDYHRFRRLAGRAREAADQGDDPTALTLLTQADALWTGEPLADLRGDWANAARATMNREWLATTLARAEVEMRLGRFSDLVTVLAPLVSAHPTHQTLVARLMLALHGAGRQDEALARYRGTYELLGDQLGIAPGPELTELHARILAGAPAADLVPRSAAKPTEPSAPPTTAAPSNLRPLRPLIGRERELAELTAGSGVVSISGMGGIGKTVLALHAARLLAERYPEGQYLVNLHANSAAQPALTPQAALAELFRALGFPSGAVPAEQEEQLALWHRVLDTHRYVIVLDDVADGAQVRNLIPANPRSFVILTSRRRLNELTGVQQHLIDGLAWEHGVALFQRLVNNERADDGDKIQEVLGRLRYHPLATEILASRFRGRTSWDLAYLAQRLASSARLVDEIHDAEQDLRLVFDFSYRSLTPDHQRAFRMLADFPGPRFALHSAAALLGLPPAEAERSLEELVDASLLEEPSPELYAYHDLLAAFASSRAETEDTESARAEALSRLLRFELAAVDRADRLLYPHRLRLDQPRWDRTGLPHWDSPAEARRWLAAELPALLAIHRRTITDRTAEATWLACSLAGFLDVEGFWQEAIELHQSSVEHFRAVADQRGQARALLDLGNAYQRAAQPHNAFAATHQALRLARLVDDAGGEAEALSQHGVLHGATGEFEAALALQREALAINRAEGDRRQVDRSLNNLGILMIFLGDLSAALAFLEEAFAGFHRRGDLRLAARTLSNIGQVLLEQGDSSAARAALERCLTVGADTLSAIDQAIARSNLAAAMDHPDDLPTALALAEDALVTFRQFNDRQHVLPALMTLGMVQLRSSRGRVATETLQEALVLATAMGADRERAITERALGVAEISINQYRSAEGHLRSALALAQRLHDQKTAAEALQALESLASQQAGCDGDPSTANPRFET